jgi:hypothetical protein
LVVKDVRKVLALIGHPSPSADIPNLSYRRRPGLNSIRSQLGLQAYEELASRVARNAVLDAKPFVTP